MDKSLANIVFTPPVLALQERHGSRPAYARQATQQSAWGPHEEEFVRERDGFYLSTVTEDGWPYIQFRGGPPGFLRVLGPGQLGFADFRGNRQYLTAGNLEGNDRVMLFLMDYEEARRLKVWGRARISEDPETVARLAPTGYRAVPERAFLIDVAAFDWNCSQHIPRRVTMPF